MGSIKDSSLIWTRHHNNEKVVKAIYQERARGRSGQMDETLNDLEPRVRILSVPLGLGTYAQGWEPVWGGGQKSHLAFISSYSTYLDAGRVKECYL